ncbi:MAG: murein L,D-transpeptidase family protein, partial [Candidatus Berkiella sp.]
VIVFSFFYIQKKPELIPIDPLYDANIQIGQIIDLIVVDKAQRRMTVFHENIPLKRYKIALGFSPIGHKTQQGDGKTPEGSYTIIAKNPKSRFHLSLKISYPSSQDILNAKQLGVSPGGEIMIHGLSKPFEWIGKSHSQKDWTLGCIALSNDEIQELYTHVMVGTKIVINP